MKHLLSTTLLVWFVVQGVYKDPELDYDLNYVDYEHFWETEEACAHHLPEALQFIDSVVDRLNSPTMTRSAVCLDFDLGD